jgi:arylsulfatase A
VNGFGLRGQRGVSMRAKWRRIGWLTGVIVGLAVMHAGVAANAARGPNIIVIVADDMGWGDVGFNGRTEWATPHLDGLARCGRIFKRCYTAAVTCAPSRAALLTGKYTIHSGVMRNDDDLPADEVTIAEALKPLGYTTALFGKWHHGKPRAGSDDYVHPMDQGFDEFFGYTDAIHAFEKFPTTLWSGRQRIPVTGYIDDLITDRAIEYVQRHKERPFFLYLPYVATHFAIAAPADEVSHHRGRLPETDPDLPLNATYAAMVTRLDSNVGRLTEALQRLGLTGQTLIVFTSDHGATFESGNQGTSAALDSNRPFRGQKRTLWEGGVRVPAFAYWPGQILPGVSEHEVIHLTDLLPTLAAAAGGEVSPAWHVDGKNLLAVWTGKATIPERTLFWEWRSEGADQLAALEGPFKLIITRGGKAELFDVENDPAERRDVSAVYPELTQRLRAELSAWLATETHR